MNKLSYTAASNEYERLLGLIVLQSDITIEDEFRYFLDGLPVSLLVNRIPFENEVTVETLKAMRSHIESTVDLFPIDARFDAVGYGCTSGALHIGDAAIENLVSQTRKCRHVTNPMQAAIAAFDAVGAKRIAYLAPYSKHVSQTMVDEIEKRGVKVLCAATFDEPLDKNVGRISSQSIKQASLNLVANTEVDAIFVSCTNMRCARIIPEVENATGVPMMSSNQVLAWHMLKSSACAMPSDKGRLFACR